MSQPVFSPVWIDSEMSTHMPEAARDSSNSYSPCGAFVSILLRSCSPHAILQRISFLVVNTLNGPSFLSRPHIIQKSGRIFPLLAKRQSSAPVIFKSGILFIEDSLFNSGQFFIGASSGSSVCDVFSKSTCLAASAGAFGQ